MKKYSYEEMEELLSVEDVNDFVMLAGEFLKDVIIGMTREQLPDVVNACAFGETEAEEPVLVDFQAKWEDSGSYYDIQINFIVIFDSQQEADEYKVKHYAPSHLQSHGFSLN